MKRFAVAFLVSLCSFTSSAQDFITVTEDSLYSHALQVQTKMLVLLPKKYAQSQERYTTLYLLHGFGGNQTDWVKYSGLVKYLKNYNYIVVCPDGRNSWYTNSIDKKRNYEDYVFSDLIPFIEKKYRTLSTRHGRVVAGLSMGGYGAVRFALKRPWMFYFAGSFSGALYVPKTARPDNRDLSESLRLAFGEERSEQWTRNDPFELLDSVRVATSLPYFYISTGKDDNLPRIVENNRLLAEKLQSKGALYEYHETPGGHTWAYWDRELRNFLNRLASFDPLNP
ncbi:MAG: alpha/beta fold hydrolase [Ignavibacteriae bacterium]|nr:alpha/beta fold hydrolase [Ignavibacteriota bacterium]